MPAFCTSYVVVHRAETVQRPMGEVERLPATAEKAPGNAQVGVVRIRWLGLVSEVGGALEL